MTTVDLGWMDAAACAARPHRGLPWLDDTAALPPVLVDLMRDVCASCPVLTACAGHVATAGVTGGFWAGADRDPAGVTGGFWAGADRDPAAAAVQLDLDDLLEAEPLGGAA